VLAILEARGVEVPDEVRANIAGCTLTPKPDRSAGVRRDDVLCGGQMVIANAIGWVTLPFVGEPLKSVIHIGNGKDAELQLTFASGSSVTLAVSRVRVEADRGVVVDVSGGGDNGLRVEYSGPNLYLHSGRFAFPEDDASMTAEFLDAAQSWLAAGGNDELWWVVEVELRLA
jgi:hypothetical protein